jgi:hypothetical protein
MFTPHRQRLMKRMRKLASAKTTRAMTTRAKKSKMSICYRQSPIAHSFLAALPTLLSVNRSAVCPYTAPRHPPDRLLHARVARSKEDGVDVRSEIGSELNVGIKTDWKRIERLGIDAGLKLVKGKLILTNRTSLWKARLHTK